MTGSDEQIEGAEARDSQRAQGGEVIQQSATLERQNLLPRIDARVRALTTHKRIGHVTKASSQSAANTAATETAGGEYENRAL